MISVKEMLAKIAELAGIDASRIELTEVTIDPKMWRPMRGLLLDNEPLGFEWSPETFQTSL